MKQDINSLLDSLAKTKFRGSFHLNKEMKNYVVEKGMTKIINDAYDIVKKRIAIKNPLNDGKQTPMKQVHPVFIAEHATGTCCRGCLERIHHISKNKELNEEEINYIINIIKTWIEREINNF